MKPITGLKLNRDKPNAFAARVSVYQPSLFAEDNVSAREAPPLSQREARAIQELNALVTAQYEMSPLQRRFFIGLVEQLPAGLRSLDGLEVVEPILLSTTALLEGLAIPPAEAAAHLEAAAAALLRHVCWISTGEGPVQVSLVGSVQHLPEQALLRVRIDPLVHGYLKRLKAYFQTAQLETLIGFKSFYSKCLYELFRKRLVAAEGVYFPLPQLKELLLIEPREYERYNDLKRFVLKRAQKELAATYLAFTFREKRNANGKVLGVQFVLAPARTPPQGSTP